MSVKRIAWLWLRYLNGSLRGSGVRDGTADRATEAAVEGGREEKILKSAESVEVANLKEGNGEAVAVGEDKEREREGDVERERARDSERDS